LTSCEVGDLAKPKLVFLFDEAHLLFNGAPAALLDQIERVTRLIRSNGVGIYYVTQSPADVPDRVSAQLGNCIHHAMRAFTPREQKAIRAAAQTMRANPPVSFLNAKGEPSIVQRALIRPPMSRVGPLTIEGRQAQVGNDFANRAKYGKRLAAPSARERIHERNSPAGQLKDKVRRFGNLFVVSGGAKGWGRYIIDSKS
jgi:uncharacterized protein